MPDDLLFTTRREFLSGSLTLLSTAGTLPVFLAQASRALAGPEPQAKPRDDAQRILVVVQLAGGNDGLNTVVPYEMDPYYKLRRTLAIPKDKVLKLEQGVGLHPAATGLKELFDDGKLAIVQGVGYPNPDRSHFTSTDIWQTADPALRMHAGWLGRYFDSCCSGADPDPEPINGIALTQEAPLALQGERFVPLAFESPEALTWRAAARDRKAAEVFRKLNNMTADAAAAGAEETPDDFAAWLQRAALKAQIGADQIRSAAGSGGGRAGRRPDRGGQLGRSLDLVARMIASDLPTRVYYVSMGGFDTHTGQDGRHQRLMQELGDSMKSFLDDLAGKRLLDRVLVMTFSEFGRRVEENASGGTDHGEAAPMFLFGSRLRPGLHGPHPDLTKLHRGDLAFGCDFRRVYAAVLRDWLDLKPDRVLKGNFQPLKLFKT